MCVPPSVVACLTSSLLFRPYFRKISPTFAPSEVCMFMLMSPKTVAGNLFYNLDDFLES